MARNPLSPYRGGMFGSLEPLSSLHREMNRLFDEVLGGPSGGPGQGGLIDACLDVSETDREIRVCAELPGVSDDDVEVSLQDDVLTIRGEKKFERRDESERHHLVERSYGTFQRSIRLPGPVDADKVEARFDNGVLTVTLPKAPDSGRRRIALRRGGSSAPSDQGQAGGAEASGS